MWRLCSSRGTFVPHASMPSRSLEQYLLVLSAAPHALRAAGCASSRRFSCLQYEAQMVRLSCREDTRLARLCAAMFANGRRHLHLWLGATLLGGIATKAKLSAGAVCLSFCPVVRVGVVTWSVVRAGPLWRGARARVSRAPARRAPRLECGQGRRRLAARRPPGSGATGTGPPLRGWAHSTGTRCHPRLTVHSVNVYLKQKQAFHNSSLGGDGRRRRRAAPQAPGPPARCPRARGRARSLGSVTSAMPRAQHQFKTVLTCTRRRIAPAEGNHKQCPPPPTDD